MAATSSATSRGVNRITLNRNRSSRLAEAVAESLERRVLLSGITTLASFNSVDGSNPNSGVIANSSGALFGVVEAASGASDGAIFELAAGSSTPTILATFNGSNGEDPNYGLVMDSKGDLFGTTETGGSDDYGTVFELPAGSSTIQDIVSFTYSNGYGPDTNLVMDSAGDIFGGTTSGGLTYAGTIFEYSASGVFSTVADFSTSSLSSPFGTLAIDSAGDIFGATLSGGADSDGGVFELPAGTSTINTLASFTTGTDPIGGVTDVGGNLFGTSDEGGSASEGMLYEVPAGSGTVATLYSFGSATGSGEYPIGGLVADASGDLYGTTATGGANDEGTVFELPSGSVTPTFLASFDGTNGAVPEGNLIFGMGGNLYGTTSDGGATGVDEGTVFEYNLTPAGPPAQLVFTTQPSTVAQNSPIVPAIKVTIEDANGNVVSSDDANIMLSVASGPANSNLNGTVGTSAVNGVSTFDNDSLSMTGTYTLTATDSTDNLTATSAPFTVTTGGPVSFGAPEVYSTGSNPFDIASGSLTGDGTVDLVTANYNGTITVLLGNGDGTFQSPQTFPDGLGSYPNGGDQNDLAIANLGTDFPDVLVANQYSHDVAVLIGNGDGTFQMPQDVYVGPYSVQKFVVADLGNGEQDLVTLDGGGNACIFLGNGDGTFSTGQTIPVAASSDNIKSLFVTDLNGDGNPDIVLADATTGTVEVLDGNGDGTFQPPQTLTVAGSNVRSAATGVFNGQNDLLVLNETGALNLLLNNGNGTFAPATQVASVGGYSASNGNGNSGGFIVGDFNGDGNADILLGTYVAGSSTIKASVLLGNGNGTFQPTPTLVTLSQGIQRVIAADLTGDGKDDVILNYHNTPQIQIRLNTSQDQAPAFTSASSYSFVSGFTGAFTVSTSGAPASTVSEIGTLPAGVSFIPLGNGDATITGTPQGTGTFVLTLEAFNGIAQGATQTFTLSVVAPPTITQTTSGLVMISGANASNTGSVTVTNGTVMINIDGQVQGFALNSVMGVTITLTTGVNNLMIGPGVPQTSVGGGSGSDTIMATNAANDTLVGGSGSNFLEASTTGVDVLQGGSGNNTLMGGGAGTIIYGKKGTGLLMPMSTGEIVRGGPGIDTIASTVGDEKIKGGVGALKIFLTGGGAGGNTILGGGGIDLAQYNPNDVDTGVFIFNPPPPSSTPAAVRADDAIRLAPADAAPAQPTAAINNGTLVIAGTNSGGDIDVKLKNDVKLKVLADGDSLGKFLLTDITGISITGGTAADTISVDPLTTLPATLSGGGGNDSITGGGGDNLEIGDDGSCTLVGGGGISVLVPGQFQTYEDGDSGTPSLVGGSVEAIADFGYRTDNLDLSNNDSLTGGAIIDSNVDAILGGTGKNTITGTSAGDFLSGGGGKKAEITGDDASDLIVASTAGMDNIVIGAEPVTLQSKNGVADTITGVNFPSEDIIVDDTGVDSLS
ncbi:MAG TPA: choice-of-anchor tandem repeat GloVer-containing protein [Tepidisphaeraceae bacterium]|nr:choice-of-anchor tandem repeat GloVer-containing protein [Tepidisphaeraceae bacterium]